MPSAERTSLARASPHARRDDPSVSDAFERLVLASQQMLSDRIGLALLDLHTAIDRAVRGGLVAGLAAGFVLGGWFALVGAAVSAATPGLPLAAALAVAGIVNLVAGAGLAIAALRAVPTRSASVAARDRDPRRDRGATP